MKDQTLFTIVFILLFTALCLAENIDPDNAGRQYAYGENVGWVNFEATGAGATVSKEKLQVSKLVEKQVVDFDLEEGKITKYENNKIVFELPPEAKRTKEIIDEVKKADDIATLKNIIVKLIQ